ncbi:hypothetical protein SDC9_90398 [bioreactor metagenome]|uniref:Uncharacterized protein n=1 Tax=bioreactor metagenome TaxID=1076179 RepID=A0A644ZV09_9ZZZZ
MRGDPLPGNPCVKEPEENKHRGKNAENGSHVHPEKGQGLPAGPWKGDGEDGGYEEGRHRRAPPLQCFSHIHAFTASQTTYPTAKE